MNNLYIYEVNKGFYIIRKWDAQTRKNITYGTFKSKEQAEEKLEQLIHDKKINPKTPKTTPKHIYEVNGRYRVNKTINGRNRYFGIYSTIEAALQRVQELQENNWIDTKKYRRWKLKEHRHIYKTKSGKYAIKRKNIHWGTFNTIEDAIDETRFLNSIDWDYDNMP